MNEEKHALVDIIARKDKEISEYKSFFGTIPKVSVSTQPFSLEDFENKYVMESHITKSTEISNTDDLWTLHTSQLFASFIFVDENKKRKLSRLLSQNHNETVDWEESTEQSEIEMKTDREGIVSKNNFKGEDNLTDESNVGHICDEQKQPAELRTRRKLLKTMSSDGKLGENVKKKKRLF
ncbi:hypothetical protein GpartN1_g2520.t1 [Galdieria partita]|uniref:Uncharacterized protein n=1 Tax=Galdieria partita TaxID=83374 RepID=A0A9C7PV00_9RHOD|nr:hypothetical protein GpartN1_g2520.t1 [Galdieria partita]